MADEFDAFLSQALAPADREADRAFVARVQARVALEEKLAAQRAELLSRLGVQMLATLSVAAGLLWLSRSPDVSGFAAESPALALALLLAAFAFLVLLLTFRTGAPARLARGI